MAHRMAEAKQGPLRVGFNRRLKLEFHLRYLYLAIGLGLLAWVLTEVDLAAVVGWLGELGASP